MKGVSAIIAIILIVMIVVALAALAYTWFTSIFSSLTTSATNATSKATTSMGMQIRIEAAKSYGTYVNSTFRNIGTVNINMGKLGVYIDGSLCPSYDPPTGTLSPGNTLTINITNTTAACPNKVLKITVESGFSDYTTITC